MLHPADCKNLSVLAYTSHESYSLQDSDLEHILIKSIAHNQRYGVTGVLLFHEGLFFQFLEGPSDALVHLSSFIEKDERHTHYTILYEGCTNRRHFPYWSMALFKPSKSSLLNVINEAWWESYGHLLESSAAADDPINVLMGICKTNKLMIR